MESINKNKLSNYNISYKQYIFLVYIIGSYDKGFLNIIYSLNKYSTFCRKLLNISGNTNIIKNKEFNIIKKEDKILNIYRYFFINKIKEKITNTQTNLIITNTTPIINEFNEIQVKVNCQLFENEEMPIDTYLNQINNLKKLKNVNEITNKQIIEYLNEKPIIKKYDNIICKINEFSIHYYYNIFTLTKLPNIIFVITQSLKQLNKGGTLYLFLRITLVNKTITKIFNLLHNSFKKIKLLDNNKEYDTALYIVCEGFLDNITPQIITNLSKDCIKSRKYNYKLCQVMEYLYYNSIKNINKELLYKFSEDDLKEIGKVDLKDIKQKSLNVLEDISINPKSNSSSKFFINLLEYKYEQFFDNLNYTIIKYSYIDNKNNIIIDDEFFNKNTYDIMVGLLNYYKKINKHFNKTYLVYINQYNKNIVNTLYDFKENINYHLVKYDINKKSLKKSSSSLKSKKSKKSKTNHKFKLTHKKRNLIKALELLKSINNYKEYTYEGLEELESTYILGIKVKDNLLEKIKTKKVPKSIKKVTEGMARGVSAYVLQNYKLPSKTSNAYMKLWEIYSSVFQLVPNKNHIKVFHLAEAPGQWINCTRHFLETKRRKVEAYDWIANSLNHKHPTNIKKFGKGIFADEYGFVKKYPDRWLYGADNTGDITKGKNIGWFNEYMKKWQQDDGKRIDLITGDAGMGSGANVKLIDLQKIDYGQLCMVAASASRGTNCVIKHFSYLTMDYPESQEGSGFFVSFMYLYYLMFEEVRLIKPHTSSPNSGEYYVVGLRFIGIDDKVLSKLIKCLDDFKVNNSFFRKDEIPESFTLQVTEFLEKLYNLNNSQLDLVNMLITCIVNPDPIILKATNCQKYLDEEFIKKIQTKRYKEWIKTYKFE